jgi:sugar phosphate isomerase/epimerase
MKLSLNSLSYHLNMGKHTYKPLNPRSIKWYCYLSKLLGMDGLYIDPLHISNQNEFEWLLEFCKNNAIHAELGSVSIFGDMPRHIRTVMQLGSDILRVYVGGSCSDPSFMTAKRVIDARTKISELLPVAKGLGIRIALENRMDVFLEDILFIAEVSTSFFGICYNSGNFLASGEDPMKAFNMLKDMILCVNLKDASREGLAGCDINFCPLGEGIAPLKKLTDELKNMGNCDMPVSIEMQTPLYEEMDEISLLKCEINNVTKSLLYAREVLGI